MQKIAIFMSIFQMRLAFIKSYFSTKIDFFVFSKKQYMNSFAKNNSHVFPIIIITDRMIDGTLTVFGINSDTKAIQIETEDDIFFHKSFFYPKFKSTRSVSGDNTEICYRQLGKVYGTIVYLNYKQDGMEQKIVMLTSEYFKFRDYMNNLPESKCCAIL
jgi:hypothetical protein